MLSRVPALLMSLSLRVDVRGSLPLWFDVVGARYGCPFRALLVEHRAKFRRSRAEWPEAEIDEALDDLRVFEGLAHLGCNSLLQCRRHVLRTEQAEQAAEREVRIAGLRNGRDLGGGFCTHRIGVTASTLTMPASAWPRTTANGMSAT